MGCAFNNHSIEFIKKLCVLGWGTYLLYLVFEVLTVFFTGGFLVYVVSVLRQKER